VIWALLALEARTLDPVLGVYDLKITQQPSALLINLVFVIFGRRRHIVSAGGVLIEVGSRWYGPISYADFLGNCHDLVALPRRHSTADLFANAKGNFSGLEVASAHVKRQLG